MRPHLARPGPAMRRDGPPNLLRLARFAQTHSHFFTDEAIDGLFAARWAAPRPRRR